jgi:hypothetical protein
MKTSFGFQEDIEVAKSLANWSIFCVSRQYQLDQISQLIKRGFL